MAGKASLYKLKINYIGTLCLLLICLFFQSGTILGQAADSILLEEVQIFGIPTEKYASGSKILRLDSVARSSLSNGSIHDLLQQETALYLREYGGGMVSTLSMRGTGASHTAVLWNGINLNSFTLGSTDFSNLPVFMFDRVEVHYGGGSSFYGSDALGGSILLKSENSGATGLQLQSHQTIGSFGQFFSGLKVHYGLGHWQFTSRVYRKKAENNFAFTNTAKFGGPEERQANADIHNQGLMQEISYQPSSNRRFSLNAWLEESENGILPLMSNNLKPETYERITDRHTRISAQYQHQAEWGYLQATAGYVRDFQRYDTYAPIKTDRSLARLQYDKKISDHLSFKTGADWQYILADTENYPQPKHQHRADAYAALQWQPLDWWELSLNLRQAWVSGYQAPLSPSLGSAIELLQSQKHSLQFKGQLARNYRVPTFNDLFWAPGGNPDLRAEHAWSYESGLLFTRQNFSAEATYYHSRVDDWIVWLDQGNFWSPANFREVVINGMEVNGRQLWQMGSFQFRLHATYAFTASINQSQVNEFDRSAGKQLPYVPRHRAGLNADLQWQEWSAGIFSQWTSRRFLTTTNESALPGFALLNLRLNKSFALWKTTSALSLRVNNLLNTEYQNIANRAMPGRNYELSLQFKISQ